MQNCLSEKHMVLKSFFSDFSKTVLVIDLTFKFCQTTKKVTSPSIFAKLIAQKSTQQKKVDCHTKEQQVTFLKSLVSSSPGWFRTQKFPNSQRTLYHLPVSISIYLLQYFHLMLRQTDRQTVR